MITPVLHINYTYTDNKWMIVDKPKSKMVHIMTWYSLSFQI